MLALFILVLFQLINSGCIASPATLVSQSLGESDVESGVVESPLGVFEVQAPLRTSYDGASCQQVVLQHTFAASYGTLYIGTYAPPKDCEFTTTIFNLSVTSSGINYDRLGLIFFGDTEIWRTTTAMPVRTGIFWNYQKDMTIYDTLLRSDQKVIMSLDNLYDSVFTGAYNVTITALYYNDPQTVTPADLILPISTQSSAQNESSVISLPDSNANVSFTLPRNSKRAVVSVLASGNGAEEFWYRNVPTEFTSTFNNTVLYGYSPFREVQVLIDGELAGVGWPFPVIFTGGISPGLWVPIVGVHTYDLPSFEVDISPWLGILCDGKPHSFEVKVVGYDSRTVFGTVGSNWWVSGAIFVWKDEGGNQTTGTTIQSISSEPSFQLMPRITGSTNSSTNTSFEVHLSAQRTLSHTSIITTSSGSQNLTWSQTLSYSSINNYTALGFNKTISALTNGTSTFSPSLDDASPIRSTFSYPITFHTASLTPTDATTANSTIVASLDRSLLSSSIPILSYLTSPFKLPTVLATRQTGNSVYYWNDTYYEFAGAIDPAMGTYGATEQWFSSLGKVGAYGRHVKAVDGYEPVLVLNQEYNSPIDVPDTKLAGIAEVLL
ncbi:Peptide-N4-(N-acetyl-beta-glucosaminyl)asparagine amidase A [Lachnellula suecica]|uniref:Peptide-N4-(N-acetyl-beta-glucosaminyl)asparagine amidase A n=1 Tax=Lachnellula suecica TaxID=602035 RepID=A0A8T9BY52_9HELO|nr:Peptide-N4-(N-acetyl-beta-glucosaminyl)asparagine amidase A [Lachnellula suecica]